VLTRRDFLASLGAFTGLALGGQRAWASDDELLLRRPIPSTGERVPAIGMGTWITFNVGPDAGARAVRRDVLRTFFERGGTLVDSSPMYGASEEVVGDCLAQIDGAGTVFSATKVWTRGRDYGVEQMEASERLWGLPRFDLLQVHNLLDWRVHLETLQAWKAAGRVRYIGVTTSHGRRHDLLEQVMTDWPLDFVQLTYNIRDRWAEARLLPLARERGIAVIANRPFAGGGLFDVVAAQPLPAWAADIDCGNWAQFFLKFIISEPAVTCAIPATSRVDHMLENMGGLRGRMPDAGERDRMTAYFAAI
jgi:diketogulonate reductase-like aldo/keto reductase